ncbi:MAG: DUF1028 domain-containing protein, partial [Promethearchaeota archaeon]
GDVLIEVKKVLENSGFYNGKIDGNYDADTKEALTKWLHTNNFEAKERNDEYIWGSIYRYMTKTN